MNNPTSLSWRRVINMNNHEAANPFSFNPLGHSPVHNPEWKGPNEWVSTQDRIIQALLASDYRKGLK